MSKDSGGVKMNRQILLDRRPSGMPQVQDFICVDTPMPVPNDGEVLLRTLALSIEPYMLLGMQGSNPMQRATGGSRLERLSRMYIDGVDVGAVMYGPTISRVVESREPNFQPGDIVTSYSGWQEFAVDDGTTLRKLDDDLPPAYAIGVLGIPGLTAYAGLKMVGMPQAGETVVVSAAMGPVGSTAGQIARIKGARVIGIASGSQKCEFLCKNLGFDAAVDRLSPTFDADLRAACPDGVDLYFENVGGDVGWAVFKLMNEFSRIPVCGLVAGYGGANHNMADRSGRMLHRILHKRIRVQGLFTFDHFALEEEFLDEVGQWIRSGSMTVVEDWAEGLDAAPQTLIDVLNGRNFGKMNVRICMDEVN